MNAVPSFSNATEVVAPVPAIAIEHVTKIFGPDPQSALALIKASFVILASGGKPIRTSARNQYGGTVIGHVAGAVSDEVALDIGGGKTIVATVTHGSGENIGFKIGDKAQALIKASHVIVAVD